MTNKISRTVGEEKQTPKENGSEKELSFALSNLNEDSFGEDDLMILDKISKKEGFGLIIIHYNHTKFVFEDFIGFLGQRFQTNNCIIISKKQFDKESKEFSYRTVMDKIREKELDLDKQLFLFDFNDMNTYNIADGFNQRRDRFCKMNSKFVFLIGGDLEADSLRKGISNIKDTYSFRDCECIVGK